MFNLLFSVLAGYKISEWICGPWVDPKLFEDHLEPDQNMGVPIQPAPPPVSPSHYTTSSKKIKWKGIKLDEDMKHLGD